MKGTLREGVPGPTGTLHDVGEQVTLLESEIFCDVSVDGRRVIVPLEAVRTTCEVPGCGDAAAYNSPGDWCERHWQEWWNTGVSGRDGAEWMRSGRERPRPERTLLADWSDDDGATHPAGTPVAVHEHRLMVMVRVEGEDVPFQLHRRQISIGCEVSGCSRESARWTPCYLCADHWDAWAQGDLDLDLDSLPEEAQA